MSPSPIDVAVVGAGAAGLMTAITAARQAPGRKIFLFDSKKRIGAKILISGGTRCNLTNAQVTPLDYNGGARHFIKHVLEAFTPEQTIEFFTRAGVPVLLEPTGKYFPTTHSGKTVLDALIRTAERSGVRLITGAAVTRLYKNEEGFELQAGEARFSAASVVLATGGLSYPQTGSDGMGLKIARQFGHTIIPTSPALTPLTSDDAEWKAISGVSLPQTRLTFFKGGRKAAETTGTFLFTHFGFSGPAALNISRHVARIPKRESPEIEAAFLPDQTEESLRQQFGDFERQRRGASLKSFLIQKFSLPERFVELFLKKIGSLEHRRVAHAFLHYPLPVAGVIGYAKAEVTAGGVDLNEVNHSTMESKRVSGLYFCGEMLDVDGRIGGFNFQWAWSSGAVAGHGAAQSRGEARLP